MLPIYDFQGIEKYINDETVYFCETSPFNAIYERTFSF